MRSMCVGVAETGGQFFYGESLIRCKNNGKKEKNYD